MSIMKAINDYDRPFHQRGIPMVIDPLNPLDVQSLTGLSPEEAFDAYLVTGGLPLLCRDWNGGVADHVRSSLTVSSPLVVTGQLVLEGEFPATAHAHVILPAIADGERAFGQLANATGLAQMTLHRALNVLVDKGAVSADRPLSMKTSKDTRYRIVDPYLRFWLRFILPQLGQIERARGDLVWRRIETGWKPWRGRAIEPVVRDAIGRILPEEDSDWLDMDATAQVGGFWTRNNDVEVDLVMADKAPAKRIGLVGSIKWRQTRPFTSKDLFELAAARSRVPGATDDTPLVAGLPSTQRRGERRGPIQRRGADARVALRRPPNGSDVPIPDAFAVYRRHDRMGSQPRWSHAMAEVLLFHHAQGLTEGMREFADELARAGHTVHLPDLYDGNVFDELTDGVWYAKEVGFDILAERGTEAAQDLPSGIVYAGFSLGVISAQRLAQTRPGAAGALLFEACLPVTEFGEAWPAGVPVQVHGMDDDEFFVHDGDIDAARALVESTEDAELFTYPGNKHLFADSSLDSYDESAARRLMERVRAFLAALK